jgi:hypothetical protein
MARITATIISTDEALGPGIFMLGMEVVDITAVEGTEVIASLNFSQALYVLSATQVPSQSCSLSFSTSLDTGNARHLKSKDRERMQLGRQSIPA